MGGAVPPEVIAGRYRVEREVGRGGMGSVWLCRDERLGRQVAVKQVGGLPGESNLHLARALREARHSAALNHPNVVAIFDALEEGDHVWLVMEYVPSRTLDQMVREDGPLDPRLAARIAADVADGLAAAHALGTVHRDVKPSNILVRTDDGRGLIADFGIARTVGQEQLTRSGLVTGTPTYFAPELARGQEPSPASDVWALGVSLYVAVEGGSPYDEQVNALALLNTIAHQPPPAPTQAGPLTTAMEHMLDPDPEARWTMARSADVLRDVAIDPLPVEESPAPVDEPLPPADEPPVDEPVPTPVRGDRPPDTVPTKPVQPALVEPEPVEPEPVEPEPVEPEPVEPQPDEPQPVEPQLVQPEPVEPELDQPEPDQPEPGPRRRRALPALVALLVVAVVGAGGWWLARDPDTDTRADRPGAEATGKPAKTPSSSAPTTPTGQGSSTGSSSPKPPDPTPSSEPSASTSHSPSHTPSPSDTSSAAEPVGADAASPADLVASYYGLLPEDTSTAWDLLTPQLQDRIGEGTFEGFWATIDDVRVNGTEEVGDDVVEVTLTYTTDGRSEQETRQLAVERFGDGYLISEDLGAV